MTEVSNVMSPRRFALNWAGNANRVDRFLRFFSAAWEDRWITSAHKSDYGKFELTHGKFYGDAQKDIGIQTSQDAKFYSTSAKFDKFSNADKTVVIQFTVKHEQNIDCGGGYVKVFGCDVDQKQFHGETPYHVMFGKFTEIVEERAYRVLRG